MSAHYEVVQSKPLRIMLCAVEPSGDFIGATLMDALRSANPRVSFVGCGGEAMAAKGFESAFSIAPLSVMGPVDAFKAMRAAYKGADRLAEIAIHEEIDSAVFIDSWSFSRIAAEQLKRRAAHVKRIKLVAPQVWASRPGRAKKLAELFDGLLTLFEFEKPWFENESVRIECIGSPAFQHADAASKDAAGFRVRYGLGDAPILVVAPGSRVGEARRLLAPFAAAAQMLAKEYDNLRIVIPAAPAARALIEASINDWPSESLLIDPAERFDAFAAARAALAASGTVTTEIAIAGAPMAVAYRVHPISAFWARRVVTTAYASLINIAAGREVIPELLQEDCTPEALAAALAPLLDETPARAAQLAGFEPALAKLGVGGPPAPARAAQTILAWTARKP